MRYPARVLLLIPHLDGGGAARVARVLASKLNSHKYEVHLGIVTGVANSSVPGHIHVHALGARRVREALPAIRKLVREIRPDAILSGMAHLNLAVLMLRPLFPRATRILVRQNAEPQRRDAGWWTPLLYRLFYRRSDAVICQTNEMAEAVAKSTGDTANLHILPNPVEMTAIRERIRERENHWTGPGPHLLAIGRLAHEKGFDLLLRVLALLRCRVPTADLTILGAGAEEVQLRGLAEQLALGESVRFAGQVTHPEEWFSGATLFVLPSRREALPNALLEAAAAGLPIAATPAHGGLRELLRGKDGVWLAGEISAAALEEAIERALITLKPEQRFEHAWIEEFRVENAVPRYEALIDTVLGGAS